MRVRMRSTGAGRPVFESEPDPGPGPGMATAGAGTLWRERTTCQHSFFLSRSKCTTINRISFSILSYFSVQRSDFWFSSQLRWVPAKQCHCHTTVQLNNGHNDTGLFPATFENAVVWVSTYLVSLAARSMCSTRA